MKKATIITLLVCFVLAGGLVAKQAKALVQSLKSLEPTITATPISSQLTQRAPRVPLDYFAPENTPGTPEFLAKQSLRDPNTCLDLSTAEHHFITTNTIICNPPAEYQYPKDDANGFIYIKGDNITLDCNGARIFSDNTSNSGEGGFGIVVYNYDNPSGGYNNVTIKNCIVDNFYTAIYVGKTAANPNQYYNITLENITFNNASQYYITAYNTSNSIIRNITKPQGSDNRGAQTIWIRDGSNNNKIYGNQLYVNSGVYVMNNSNYNKIYNNEFGYIIGTDANKVALDLDRGSDHNEVYNNQFTDITGSLSKQSVAIGLYGDATNFGAHDNTIHNNTINNVDVGIYMNHDTKNNLLYENHINNANYFGIWVAPFETYYPNYNTFSNNLINTGSATGVSLGSGTNNNKFYKNTFLNNATQATDNGVTTASRNLFYDTATNRGNNWNNYDEPPEGCNDVNADTVCDLPFTGISGTAGSQDPYPTTGRAVFTPIDPIVANERDMVVVSMHATDPEGDLLTYRVGDSRFNSLEACVGDQWVWGWGTNKWSAGHYTFNAYATDGAYEVSSPFDVTVNDTCHLNKWGVMVCYGSPIDISCK